MFAGYVFDILGGQAEICRNALSGGGSSFSDEGGGGGSKIKMAS